MENTIAPQVQKNASVVAFKLNRRTFALPLDVIVQILPMMTVTPIPHLSSIVKGTINIRGEDVLVVSLRGHFNMQEADLQLYTPLLLLKLGDRSLALIVDAVLDVMNLPLNAMTQMQSMLPQGVENLPLLKGVSHFNNDTILVLDPDNLFYNHHSLIQSHAETGTVARADLPVKGMAVEDTLAAIVDKVEAAEKQSAAAAPAAREKPATSDIPAVQETTPDKNVPAAQEKPADADIPAAKEAAADNSASAAEEKPASKSRKGK